MARSIRASAARARRVADIGAELSSIAAPPGSLPALWRAFAANRSALAGAIVILLLLAVALAAPLLAPHSPIAQDRSLLLAPPAWIEGGSRVHLLGTDDIGRDLLSRLLYGTRLSLLIGLMVVSLSLLVGVAVGLAGGFFGGLLDFLLMRVMDMLQALPPILLAITVVAILGPGLVEAMLAVSFVALPNFARIARATTIAERGKDYVTASRLAGAGSLRLMLSTILPNCVAPIIVTATLGFSDAILNAAALGFLGLGAQPPTPEWGSMLADSRAFIERAWWIVTFPGLAILITVLAFNLTGDGLRDALDPKLAQRPPP
jgi:dipeptide transport system permease protein